MHIASTAIGIPSIGSIAIDDSICRVKNTHITTRLENWNQLSLPTSSQAVSKPVTARVKAGRLASASIDYTKLTKKIPPTIVWLRRDLRIGDNPALHHAAKSDKPVLIIYIDELKPDDPWSTGAASKWWLHHSLKSLTAELKLIGGRLRIFQGDPKAIITKLITETGADTVLWNRRYEPTSIAKDQLLKTHLSGKKIDVRSFPGNLCHEPWTVKRQESHPYKVFTAYWRASLLSLIHI